MNEQQKIIDPNRQAAEHAYRHLRLAHERILRAATDLRSGSPEGLMWEDTLVLRDKVEALKILADDCRTMAADMAYSDDWRGEKL